MDGSLYQDGRESVMLKKDEIDWYKVYNIRIKCKGTGYIPNKDEIDLLESAYFHDPSRYKKMDKDIFNATVPFGSNVRK